MTKAKLSMNIYPFWKRVRFAWTLLRTGYIEFEAEWKSGE